jgi:hypothetical protein
MKTGKIELLKVRGFKRVTSKKDGKDYIYCPVDAPGFYDSEETKRLYLDLVMVETPKSEYSDYMVKESLSKEDRENGVELDPIGNFKNYRKPDSSGQTTGDVPDENDDALPF